MRYTIYNAQSGVVLGTYEGGNENEALDAMARDAGYRDYSHASEVAPADAGEIVVEPAIIVARLTEAGQAEAIQKIVDLSGEWLDYASIFQRLEERAIEMRAAGDEGSVRVEIRSALTHSRRPEFVVLDQSAFDFSESA